MSDDKTETVDLPGVRSPIQPPDIQNGAELVESDKIRISPSVPVQDFKDVKAFCRHLMVQNERLKKEISELVPDDE